MEDKSEATMESNLPALAYHLEPVNIRDVKLKDSFWLPVIERVQQKTIEFAIEKCREEGRLDNFLMAGGQLEGTVKGAMPFDDTDVYKIIEGASYSLISSPNEQLSQLLDSLIGIVAIGQEKDGYLTTWRTINPAQPPATWVEVKEGKRWESLFMSHELYNAGHLYEAAAAHYRATGKKNFLDIALKNADLMVNTFGDGTEKIHAVPGHQIIETGLIKLYQITGREDYLTLSKYFLDHRGDPENHKLFGAYSQDHVPVIDQDEVVGHAVRAVYMYAAMTDIAALEQDSAYYNAVNALWDNMVNKKMYVTGGIGAKHDGEAFGENYELPNLTAYNETCAAIGDVYWNQRLHNINGDVKYYDIIERTLYNGLISGISLDGVHFFYPNALESDGKYEFNRGACTRQSWFDCSCCPTNLIRFIPAIPGLMYSKKNDEIYVNLYASSDSEIDLADGSVTIEQRSGYPWKGDVNLELEPKRIEEFTVKLRVPGWSRNEVLPGDLYSYVNTADLTPSVTVNGENITPTIEEGYIVLKRSWKAGDKITMNIPMEPRFVKANAAVTEDQGKLALEYGPLVYAVEEMDNTDIDNISISSTDKFQIVEKPELLGGINMLQSDNINAIPYYSWSNRGIGKMKVWLNEKVEN
ncbi:glycoside hydrolase family 127 protein [Robertkochia solimangrovi]|uniref:glycoside hydrolase family 127 protein n=1 Tax=Robertkochia solimangrovi TaxID=2213046 RepID=UPI001F54FFD3|nr:glycoside hydrolase family 127 protein [Robertkochia solimangrovi]